jgi:hypothetical protein
VLTSHKSEDDPEIETVAVLWAAQTWTKAADLDIRPDAGKSEELGVKHGAACRLHEALAWLCSKRQLLSWRRAAVPKFITL